MPVAIRILTVSVSPSQNCSAHIGLLVMYPILGKKISTDFTLQKETVKGHFEIYTPKPHRKSKRRTEVTNESPGLMYVLNFA